MILCTKIGEEGNDRTFHLMISEWGQFMNCPYGVLNIFLRFFVNGFRMSPFSVMMPSISELGVTSNAGLEASIPLGATGTPRKCVTSPRSLSSIGIDDPEGKVKSSVEVGAAT